MAPYHTSPLSPPLPSPPSLLFQREAAERLAEIERRHLQAKLSYEDAIIARENHLKDRHLSAKAVKKEVYNPILIFPYCHIP